MSKVERLCGNPSCDKAGIHLCSGCGEEIYCSKDCQKNHWNSHKLACQRATKAKTAAAVLSLESLSVKQLKNVLKAKAATFDAVKKSKVLNELEKHIEKETLVKYVSEYVKPSEVQSLLSATNTTTSEPKPTKQKKSNKTTQPIPTPDQLRQQAAMMRKNPAMVRKANPAFSNMTDDQIRQYADHIEQAASDPAMMKEIEKMANLDSKDRNTVQMIQEGLTGVRPMDNTWIDSTIAALKNNPSLFKNMMKGKGAMMGGVSNEQVESCIYMAAAMDARFLKIMFHIMKFIGNSAKPVTEYYKIVDNYTMGLARYIVMALIGLCVYFIVVGTYYFWRWVYIFVMGFFSSGNAPAAAGSTSLSSSSSSLIESLKSNVINSIQHVSTSLGLGSSLASIMSTNTPQHIESKESPQHSESISAEFENEFPIKSKSEETFKKKGHVHGDAADAEFDF